MDYLKTCDRKFELETNLIEARRLGHFADARRIELILERVKQAAEITRPAELPNRLGCENFNLKQNKGRE